MIKTWCLILILLLIPITTASGCACCPCESPCRSPLTGIVSGIPMLLFGCGPCGPCGPCGYCQPTKRWVKIPAGLQLRCTQGYYDFWGNWIPPRCWRVQVPEHWEWR